MATITKIPASKKVYSKAPIGKPQKRKVAGYARVSTDHEEQLTSYEAQLDYYTKYIAAHADWEFAGMYSDEGISGTSTKHRDGFNRMVADALAGKIDLILTKSVSRFARNTVDSLTTIRELKDHGTEVFFEKENIWTFDSKGELLISIMASLSQEESRSISENVKWGQRKRFSDGKASVAYSKFLGYDKGPDGSWVINEEQAKTVRLIFKLFLEGYSYTAIANILTEDGVDTGTGAEKWWPTRIQNLLKNEKMCGNCLLQKTFTVDYLTKTVKKNEGEIPQYFVKNHHAGIVSQETFDLVQQEIKRRASGDAYYSGSDIFSSKVRCGECGGAFGQKVWHSNDKYRKVVWRCNHKYKEHGRKGKGCSTPHLTEDEIKAAFVKAMNLYISEKDEIIRNIRLARQVVADTSELELKQAQAADEMNAVDALFKKSISANARVAQDQAEYRKHQAELTERYVKAENEYNRLGEEIAGKRARNLQLGQILKNLEAVDGTVNEFDAGMWGTFLRSMTVYEEKRIVARMKDGTEIEVKF